MTQFSLRPSVGESILRALEEAGFRSPSSVGGPNGRVFRSASEQTVITYLPDLTVAEQATFDTVARLAIAATLITPAERTAIEPDLAAMRTFRQRSQSEFMALTATQRDRELFDLGNAQTNVLRALLRD